MAMRNCLTTIADRSADDVLRTVRDAVRDDGCIDRRELPALIRSLRSLKRATTAADHSTRFALAVMHGVGTGPYFDRMSSGHLSAVDEVSEPDAA